MQTKANRPNLGKAEQSKRVQACPGISGRPNQDSTDTNRRTQTKTTRQTRPGPINQHRRPRPYETYTRQTKSNEADRRSANQTHHNRSNRSSHQVSTHESNHFKMRIQASISISKNMTNNVPYHPQIISKRMEATQRYLQPPPKKHQSKHIKRNKSEH